MERNILFKCLNCNNTFEINIGDFVNLKCQKCGNTPTHDQAKLFKSAIKNIYILENSKDTFSFDFQYPSIAIY